MQTLNMEQKIVKISKLAEQEKCIICNRTFIQGETALVTIITKQHGSRHFNIKHSKCN